MTTPRSLLYRPERLDEHERLARVLPADDRQWLRRMADVLEPGHVVVGMALRRREGVVPDSSYPGGVRLVRAPSGPAGVGVRPLPPEAFAVDPSILVDSIR